jgi:hypothetical protein
LKNFPSDFEAMLKQFLEQRQFWSHFEARFKNKWSNFEATLKQLWRNFEGILNKNWSTFETILKKWSYCKANSMHLL